MQRRADFGEPRESFHRNWVEYRSGFGDPIRELWIGNINLHLLTNSEDQVLRIELEDFDGERRYAEYSTFRVNFDAFHTFPYYNDLNKKSRSGPILNVSNNYCFLVKRCRLHPKVMVSGWK